MCMCTCARVYTCTHTHTHTVKKGHSPLYKVWKPLHLYMHLKSIRATELHHLLYDDYLFLYNKWLLKKLSRHSTISYAQHFVQHHSVQLNSIWRWNCLWWSMWILKWQVSCSYVLHSLNTWGKKWKNNEAVHYLFIECKKAYDSVRRRGLT